MKRLPLFLVFFLCSISGFSQPSLENKIKMWGDMLIMNPSNPQITQIQDAGEQTLSHRLGIRYQTSTSKFLISYLPPENLRLNALNKEIPYELSYQSLEENFGVLTLRFDDSKHSEFQYYFESDTYISPITYFTRNWKVIESKYFRFKVEDSAQWNEFSIASLDAFVGSCGSLLKLSDADMALLAREKILYILSESEQSIKNITGYASRGQYNLAYDAVITTYNAHFHEVAHLLVNFKFRTPTLYTHPFLQEGIAVALGGRGGLSPEPLFTFADFALQSGFLEAGDLLTLSGFAQTPPSMSYPVAGFVVQNFIAEHGMDTFLKLYKQYSSNKFEDIPSIDNEDFEIEVMNSAPYKSLNLLDENFDFTSLNTIDTCKNNSIYEDAEAYYFNIKDTLLIESDTNLSPTIYQSSKFEEVFPDDDYHQQRYLLIVNDAEIALYDLFTNTLLTNHVAGFQRNPTPFRTDNSSFKFSIDKGVLNALISNISQQ